MKMGIHIVSWVNDAEWLDCCLRSIRRFCSGYHRVQVSSYTPDALAGICARHEVELLPMFQNPSRGERYVGYLLQQVQKFYADINLPDCDHILFVDSDCIFKSPNSPQSWLLCGKPILHVQSYDSIALSDPCHEWRPITEKALGWCCNYETMRRHPFCFPSDVVRLARERIERVHEPKTIQEYILDQPSNDFSEFNAIGSYAVTVCPNRFAVVRLEPGIPVRQDYAKVFRSWGGITPAIRAEIEEILK